MSGAKNWSNGSNVMSLDDSHVCSLKTFGAFLYFELHFVAFVEALVAAANDGFEVHKHIFAGLTLDEAETLGCVEPLYDARFHWTCLSYGEQKIRST